jgi:hypothetical protein
MNKEEILAKSRESFEDEGIDYAISKGIQQGVYYGGAVSFVLIILALITQQWLVIFAVLTLEGAHSFGNFLALYRHFKQKRYIVGFVLFGLVFGGVFAFLFVREIGLLQGWWG